MKIWYDTEFLEDGRTIELISIGMVREDGAEYYGIVDGTRRGRSQAWLPRIGKHEWLLENVVPSLPVTVDPMPARRGGTWNYVTWNRDHPDWPHVKPRKVIADEVRDFILSEADPQLWAWYAAYDHVALCQLWGRMIDLPQGVPMWTNDLKQEAERLGNPVLPADLHAHNALTDARRNRAIDEYLAGLSLAKV